MSNAFVKHRQEKIMEARKYGQEFYRIFHTSLDRYYNVLFGFMICEFNEQYIQSKDGVSLKKTIREKYGDRAVELVQILIKL